MTVQNHDIDDGLTDEERAALVEDEGEDTTAKAVEPGEEGADPSDAEAAAAAEAAATPAEAAKVAAEEPEAQPQPAPILVAPAPEDAAAKLGDIEVRKDALLNQFDEGDITAREYQKQLDTLAKEERAIERAQDRAELAGQMEQQRLQNDWTATCNTFVDTHAVYKDNPRLYKALDAEVRELAGKPETSGWSGQKFLDEAHKALKTAFGFAEADAPKAGAKDAPRQTRQFPPNLAKVPAANLEDTSGNRFAVLDRMASSDPVGYEEAIAKMPDRERDAYLAAG